MYYHYKYFKNEEEHWPSFSDENNPESETPVPAENSEAIKADTPNETTQKEPLN